jgi:hypothetical protein
VRSDVAIIRKRAPEEGRSRRLRSREAPIRESGGTILPTTRPADLSQHDRRHRPATSPLGQGAPSDGRPASSRPTPDRGVRPVQGRHLRLRGSPAQPTCVDARAAPSAPEAGLHENGLASRLDHQDHCDRAQRSQRPTPDGSPWEGSRPPADSRHPTPSLRGRAASGRGPTLSRTVRSLTRIRHWDNRAAGAASQILVHGFRLGPHFIGHLSTELPTGGRHVDLTLR